MISYRLYCLKDGCILSTTILDAENDIAAIEAARASSASVDCELWCDTRLVAFIPAVAEES